MTEPGFVQPAPTGWWARKDRVGINENETDWVTTTSGSTPKIYYKPVMRPANPKVGPQAMRNKFRRKPQASRVRVPPVFDSAATATQALITANSSVSWSHTVGPNTTCVLVQLLAFTAGYSTVTATATFGGQAMTQLGLVRNFSNDGTYGGELWLFGLVNQINMPTGTQTVQITYANQVGFNDYTSVGSVAYRGVAGLGAAQTTTGNAAISTQTVTGATPGESVYQVFAKWTTTFASFSGNQRLNLAYSAGNGEALVAGETIATQSSVTTTTNEAAQSYAGIGLSLQPIT